MSRQNVLAGNMQEAMAMAGGVKCSGRVNIINDVEDLRGLRPGSIVWVGGTYHQRKDFDEIAEACSARDISFVDPCASLKGVR